MMLLALALATQTTTLPADPREAALTCGAAVRVTHGPGDFEGVVLATYFSLTAASMTGTADGLPDRSSADTKTMMDRANTLGDTGPALLAQCNQRFPLAFARGPVKLPSDDYDRRTLCLVSGTIVGTYLGYSDKAAGEAMSARFGTLVSNAEMAQRGLTNTASYKAEMGRIFMLSLPLGNFAAIEKSCEAAFPA